MAAVASTFRNTVKEHKKLFIALAIGSFLSGGLAASDSVRAAIPVIDTENILKQLQTYQETVKVVTNTSNQIALMLKDMGVLSEDEYKKYTGKIEEGRKAVASALAKQNGIFSGTAGIAGEGSPVDVNKFLTASFPGLTKEATLNSQQTAILTGVGAIMRNNEDSLKAYQELMTQLDSANKDLADLMAINNTVEGSVQAQQVNNQIQAVHAQINGIKTALGALDAQQKVMDSQMKAQEKKNQIQMDENNMEATRAAGDAIKAKADSYGGEPVMGGGFGYFVKHMDD